MPEDCATDAVNRDESMGDEEELPDESEPSVEESEDVSDVSDESLPELPHPAALTDNTIMMSMLSKCLIFMVWLLFMEFYLSYMCIMEK